MRDRLSWPAPVHFKAVSPPPLAVVHKNYLPALQKSAARYWLNVENASRFVLRCALCLCFNARAEKGSGLSIIGWHFSNGNARVVEIFPLFFGVDAFVFQVFFEKHHGGWRWLEVRWFIELFGNVLTAQFTTQVDFIESHVERAPAWRRQVKSQRAAEAKYFEVMKWPTPWRFTMIRVLVHPSRLALC
jgi:hypothetical protein